MQENLTSLIMSYLGDNTDTSNIKHADKQMIVRFNFNNERFVQTRLHFSLLQWLLWCGRVSGEIHNALSRCVFDRGIPLQCLHRNKYYSLFRHGCYFYKFNNNNNGVQGNVDIEYKVNSFPMIKDHWMPLNASHLNFLVAHNLEVNYSSRVEQLPLNTIPYCTLLTFQSRRSSSSSGETNVPSFIGLENPFERGVHPYPQFCDNVLAYFIDCLKSLQHLHGLNIVHGNINEFTLCISQQYCKPKEKPKRSRSQVTCICNPSHVTYHYDLVCLGKLFTKIFAGANMTESTMKSLLKIWRSELDTDALNVSAKLCSDYIIKRLLCMIFFESVSATLLLHKYSRWVRYKSNHKRMLDKRVNIKTILTMRDRKGHQPLREALIVVNSMYTDASNNHHYQQVRPTLHKRRPKQIVKESPKKIPPVPPVVQSSPKKRKSDSREVLSSIDNCQIPRSDSANKLQVMTSPTKKKKIANHSADNKENHNLAAAAVRYLQNVF